MLEYHAAYSQGEDGWIVAEVLDFPGVITQRRTLKSARRMARDAMKLMAECLIESGEPLPRPKSRVRFPRVVFFEIIQLKVRAQVSRAS